MKKQFASCSVDLDNKWAYLKSHGDPRWESMPSYLPEVIPRILDWFDDREISSTFFVVGQDAEMEVNHESLGMIPRRGHEIANHSFHHEPWLHLYPPDQLVDEFGRAEKAIQEATGELTRGFRGPGFSLSDEVLRTLMRRGYVYDGTSFPTFLGPVARLYYFMSSGLSREQRDERKELFGRFTDGFKSLTPWKFHWRGKNLVEVPVTTMPLLKLPIHGSYLLFLGQFSATIAKFYFWMAMKLCRLMSVEPHFLLHPLDFMGYEDDQDLLFFPGMNQQREKKLELLTECMEILQDNFEVLTMHDHVQQIRNQEMPVSAVSMVPGGAGPEIG